MPKLMFMPTIVGIVSATTRPPISDGAIGRAQLVRDASGSRASTLSTFQFSGRSRDARHLRHALDLFVAEAVEAAVGDELERRPRVVAHHLAQREHLVELRVDATARAAPSPSLCVYACDDENPRPPAAIDSASSVVIASSCSGVGRAADRVLAHHRAADRAVADEEARVHAEVALEPGEVVAERPPVPVEALLERAERHALDARHHAPEVVGVVVAPSGASVKPQLPPMTVVTPWRFDGDAAGSQSSCAS